MRAGRPHPTNPYRRKALAAAFAAALAGLSAPGLAVDAETSLKLKLGMQGEGDRSLGASGEADPEAYVEAAPALHLQFTPGLSAYVRAQGFLPSGEISQEEDERSLRAEGYVALREAWIDYGGLSSYPGEVLRLGLQRLRQTDGQWLDRDIEALRWLFDTTLIQAQVGVAQQFSSYRSDEVDLSDSQKDRLYAYSDLGGQWRPGHFLGLRAIYSQDHEAPPDSGSVADPEQKLVQRHYGWIGLRADNGYYEQSLEPLSYWGEASVLVGRRKTAELAPDPGPEPAPDAPAAGTVLAVDSRQVRAAALDLGLRGRFETGSQPVLAGLAYVLSQGRADGDSYEQTGLQSNRSRYTGTRSLIHRYNEAYRAELGNLRVLTGFLALPGERYDASLVYSRFRRGDANAPVLSRGLTQAPTVASRDLGEGYDLVLSWYFAGTGGLASYDDDLRSNLRLRTSLFQPGEAYGADAEDYYRLMLEATLWF